jgi:hypothetical protein
MFEKVDVKSVGKEVGLEGGRLELFVKYFTTRWPNEFDYGYCKEWANRFKYGCEYQASDGEGQRLLKKISPYGGQFIDNQPNDLDEQYLDSALNEVFPT